MDRIRIVGGRQLKGEIPISGAKNAALPLMAASLLTEDTLTLENLPHLVDITTQVGLLVHLGVQFHLNGQARNNGHSGRVLEMCASRITSTCAPYDLVRKMRASILVLGPLVARMGHAEVSLPGGCAIGTRPVDLHLSGLEQLGARIELTEGYVRATAPDGLTGAEIVFPTVSVGATENLMMAAALARGETRLVNAAREPEIGDLADCLQKMGADISGVGSDTLVIRGVPKLHGAVHSVIPDRIETGTYAMAAAITDGEIDLIGARAENLGQVIEVLQNAGVALTETNRGLSVRRANGGLHACDVATDPYPGFPTDLQAQLLALMSVADGDSRIAETIFENRFMHVPELARMGANITVDGTTAIVHGPCRLTGAPVMATDLRASVSLVLAGLAAEGETQLSRVYHLDRGYERLEAKLAACGAEIERIRA
jgi:UDP-N-acetylglucosamine 1-carboxyvinyltransferase